MSSHTSAPRARVEAAMAGTLELSELSTEEAVVLNAEITASVEENLLDVDFGAELAAEGVTTVALDDNGDLTEYRPDGTTRVLGTAGT